MEKFALLSSRWIEPLDHITGPERATVRAAAEWCDLLAPADRLHNAAENFFLAKDESGAVGYLLEFELDDDSEATPEGAACLVEAVTEAAPAGRAQYVPPMADAGIYNERAAYQVFFPTGPNVGRCARQLEAAAGKIMDSLY